MSRFYDLNGKPQTLIPKVDGSGLRPTHIGDAKKHGWVASVSTISGIVKLDDFLTDWKIGQYMDAAAGSSDLLARNHEEWKKHVKKEAEKAMSAAPELGSRVHGTIERYHRLRAEGGDMSALQSTDPDLLPYLIAVHQFCEEHNIKALSKDHVERRVVVKSARSAGTCDFVGKWGKDLVVLDWKSQKVRKEPRFYPQFPIQLAAYWAGLGKKGKIVSVVIDTSKHGSYDADRGILPGIHYKFYDSPITYYKFFEAFSRYFYIANEWPEPESVDTPEAA